jgi:hypothetical protein
MQKTRSKKSDRLPVHDSKTYGQTKGSGAKECFRWIRWNAHRLGAATILTTVTPIEVARKTPRLTSYTIPTNISYVATIEECG